jgi:hypothetical protein
MKEQPNQAECQAQQAQVCVVHPALVVAEAEERNANGTHHQSYVLCEVEVDFVPCGKVILAVWLLLLWGCCCRGLRCFAGALAQVR